MIAKRSLSAVAVAVMMTATWGCGDDEATPASGSGGTGGIDSTGGTSTGGVGGSGAQGGQGGSGGDGCPDGSHLEAGECVSTLAAWSSGPSLPKACDHHTTFVGSTDAGDFLFVLGGVQNNSQILNDVQRASIASDGSLGDWEAQDDLPAAMAGHGIALVGDTLVLTGGRASNFAITANTRRATLASDGTLADWTDGPDMGVSRFHHTTMAHGQSVYAVGGLTGAGTFNTDSVQRLDLSAADPAWEEQAPLPMPLSHHATAIAADRLYVLGGLTGDPAGQSLSHATVLMAPFDGDGNLGAWEEVGELPFPLTTHAAFVHEEHIYVVGGIEGSSKNADSVRRSAIAPDGTLGDFELMPALPTARAHAHQTPIFGGFVYAPGGAFQHQSLDDVFIGSFE